MTDPERTDESLAHECWGGEGERTYIESRFRHEYLGFLCIYKLGIFPPILVLAQCFKGRRRPLNLILGRSDRRRSAM